MIAGSVILAIGDPEQPGDLMWDPPLFFALAGMHFQSTYFQFTVHSFGISRFTFQLLPAGLFLNRDLATIPNQSLNTY